MFKRAYLILSCCTVHFCVFQRYSILFYSNFEHRPPKLSPESQCEREITGLTGLRSPMNPQQGRSQPYMNLYPA